MLPSDFIIAPNKEGILLVDKPSGISSHAVVRWARQASDITRVGHAGTLDPLATGLLIILIGRQFTKRQSEFLKQDKIYQFSVVFGVETDTLDCTGEECSRTDWSVVSQLDYPSVEKVLDRFRGEVQQVVPLFSAVRQRGKKLYKYARQGKAERITLPIRTVQIQALELFSFELDQELRKATASFQVACGSGTYVRSLARDIGIALGVGATVTQLRRIASGSLSIDQATCCGPIVADRA